MINVCEGNIYHGVKVDRLVVRMHKLCLRYKTRYGTLLYHLVCGSTMLAKLIGFQNYAVKDNDTKYNYILMDN